MKNNNLDSKIEHLQSFIDLNVKGVLTNILSSHLNNYRNIKKPNDKHVEALKRLFDSYVESINIIKPNEVLQNELKQIYKEL